jgi:WD40 repeat protein
VAFNGRRHHPRHANANGDAFLWNTYLWNAATEKHTATLTVAPPDPSGSNDNVIFSVAFTPDGTILATGDASGKTYLWRVTQCR